MNTDKKIKGWKSANKGQQTTDNGLLRKRRVRCDEKMAVL